VFLTIKEYVKRYGDRYEDYLNRHAKNGLFVYTIVHGLIEWEKETSHMWAGPFPGNCVGVTLTDHSRDCNIKTLAQIMEQVNAYSEYSVYNYPRDLIEQILGKDVLKIISTEGDLCGRSKLTYQETQTMLSRMTPEQKLFREKRMEEEIAQIRDTWPREMPHVEKPYCLRLYGNDDTSYSRLFSILEEAKTEIEILVKNPSADRIYKEFVFTN
jgi:hypothetical protein